MPSIVAIAEAGFEPIPGYVLRERLGTGGFGEVWLADAPGGLKKAIKFVFGSIDESRAANELKALQRIRAVNHPFVLSLERIEIVNGQLIVVTELADSSLHDKYCEMRKRGLAGIPRDRLLRYLSDAADALDYICQQFDLQHLDVKPANLLLVADHIKLADFGLIKDLQRTNNSLMSGLTPTYAAPEMFDGRPGRNSDQYALAIVYQEMLTGTFPFQGRTTAQLATEHVHKAPNLEPLPVHDRAIIARAMSKKPSQRFSSCRELIDHLVRATGTVANTPEANDASPTKPRAVTKPRVSWSEKKAPTSAPRGQWLAEAQTRTAVQSQNRVGTSSTNNFSEQRNPIQTRSLPPLDIPAVTHRQDCNVFIGLGRTGMEALIATRQRLSMHPRENDIIEPIWLGIDTDRKSIDACSDSTLPGALSRGEIVHLPLRDPQYYKEQPREWFTPISRRWLYNIPRSKNTEGVRALGLLAFLDNTFACYDALGSSIAATISRLDQSHLPKNFNIYLVASAHGGTGSALIAEIGFLVRRVLVELRSELQQLAPEKITAILTAGSNEENAAYELASASAVACVQEIEHYNRTTLHPGFPTLPPFPLSAAPIDDVYLIHGGRLGRNSDWQQAIGNVADFLSHDAFSGYGLAMRSVRQELHKVDSLTSLEYHPWLRSFSSTQIQLTGNIHPKDLAKHWTLEVLINWHTALNASLAQETSDMSAQDAQSRALPFRKTLQAVELFCDDLFRENHWNAQAWVRSCFEKLLPESEPPQAMQGELQSGLEKLLAEKSNPAIDEVQKALDIHLETCQTIAGSLIDNGIKSMIAFIRKYWLNHQSNLAFVGLLLNRINHRLLRNAESLTVVSNRFSEKLERVEASIAEQAQLNDADLQQIESELSTLAVQKSVHTLAALLLQRIAQLVLTLDDLWQGEVIQLRANMKSFYLKVAQELNLGVDDNQQVQQVYFPLPGEWKQVRVGVQGALDHYLATHACGLMDTVWTIERAIETESSSDTSSFEAMKQRRDCIDLSHLSHLAEKMLVENASKRGIATTGEIEKISTHMSADSIGEAIRGANCAMLTEGSAKRILLILPRSQAPADGQKVLPKEMLDVVSIVYSELADAPFLIIDGEQIHLDDLVHQLWPMNSNRAELIKRLFTRIDVDWPDLHSG